LARAALLAALLAVLAVVWPALAAHAEGEGFQEAPEAQAVEDGANPKAPAAQVAAEVLEWSAAPADADGPDGRVSLRRQLDAGAQVTDHIAVVNHSPTAAVFDVVTGAGVVGADGVFDIAPAGGGDAGGWVSVAGLADGQLRLDPGEQRVVPVAITVPADASPGDHPAGIAVGVSQGAGVTLTHRIGVRLHLRVAGDVEPALTATLTAVRYTPSWLPFGPGRLTVDYEVANPGDVRLGAKLAVTAAGPFGWGQTTVAADPVAELLPGESVARTAELAAPSLFWLRATLTATPTVVGADQVSPPPTTAATTALAAIPWSGLAVTGVIAAAVAWSLWRRRRARSAATASLASEAAAVSASTHVTASLGAAEILGADETALAPDFTRAAAEPTELLGDGETGPAAADGAGPAKP
jgi:hypothetical protein